MKEVFYRTNEDGLIEAIDPVTGDVVALQQSTEDLYKKKSERLIKTQLPSGETVYLEKGLSLDNIPTLKKAAFPYSEVLKDLICDKIIAGQLLTAICKEPGLPNYQQIARWRREIPEFAEAVYHAMQSRAEHYHDEIYEKMSEKTYLLDKKTGLPVRDDEGSPIPAAPSSDHTNYKKMQLEALKWLAEKGDQERFGKPKHTGHIAAGGVNIFIDTGIRREGDPGFIKDVTPGVEQIKGKNET